MRKCIVLFSFLAVLGLALFPSIGVRAETLTILHTNDTHSHLTPFELKGFGKNVGGLAARAEYFQKIRGVASHVLVLDGGDIFQGTAFYSFFKGEVDLKGFALCGYEATTLGNHDLDDGLENLNNQLKIASFPMLCCNVIHADSGALVFPPLKIVERGGLKVALIGIIGREAFEVIPIKNRRDLRFQDLVKTVQPLVDQVREKVDLVVLLSHSGYESDLELALNTEGIDVIIGGHTNTFVEKPMLVKRNPTLVKNLTKNRIGGTLVLQAFKWGVYVGRLDLTFNQDKDLVAFEGHLDLISDAIRIPPDSPVQRLVSAYEDRIGQQTSQVIGHLEEAMDCREDEKHKSDVPLGTFICDALREFGGADIAIVNSGTIRDALPAGNITLGHIFNAFPFDNSLMTMKLKGQAVQEMLDFISANYGKITGYQYGGLSFTIDLREKKAMGVLINGKPLAPEKEYKLATTSYLTDGNQNGNILFKTASGIYDHGFSVRDVIIEYVRKHGLVKPPPGKQIHIRP